MDLALRTAFRRLQNDQGYVDSFVNQAMRAGPSATISTVPAYYYKCELKGSSRFFPSISFGEMFHSISFGDMQKYPDRLFPSPRFSYFHALSFINYPTNMIVTFEDFRIEDEDTYNEIYDKYGIHPILEFGLLRLVFSFDGSKWVLADFSITNTPIEEPVLLSEADIDAIMAISRRFIVGHIQPHVNKHFKDYYEDYLDHARNYCACALRYLDSLEKASIDDLNDLLCEASYGRQHLGELYWVEPHPTFEGAGFYRPVDDLQEQIDRLRGHYLLYQLHIEAGRYAVPPNFPPDFSDEVPEDYLE